MAYPSRPSPTTTTRWSPPSTRRRCSSITTSTTRPTSTTPTRRWRAPSGPTSRVDEVLKNLELAPRRQAGPRAQQRRRPLQPLALLGVRWRRTAAARPTAPSADAINSAFGSFDDFKAKFKAAGVGQFGSGWAWLVHDGSGLAVVSTRQPGQPGLRRQDAAAGHRRLGARLLPQVPEPSPGLHRRLVERRQLGQGGRGVLRRLVASPRYCLGLGVGGGGPSRARGLSR